MDIPIYRIDKSKTKADKLDTTFDHTTQLNRIKEKGRIINIEEANDIKRKENNSGTRINYDSRNNIKIVNQIYKNNSDFN